MHRISIFGDIGGFGITADSIKQQLDTIDPATPLIVEINSQGGSVSEGMAIFNLLKAWPGGVTIVIVGWCLSIATVIAMAGRVIQAHETSMIMVHAAWVTSSGNANQLREEAALLDQVNGTMSIAYGRTGQPASVIAGWLDGADHWFTAADALVVGLIDEVIPANERAAAPIDVRACRFNVPAPLKERILAMPQTHAPANEAEIRAAALRADNQRRQGIRAKFASFASFGSSDPKMVELMRECEDDPQCTPQAAGQRILAAQAATMSSAAGHYSPRSAEETRMSDFRAACTDVLLQRAGIAVKEPHPAAQDVRGLSIAGMAERVLSMHGRSVSSMSRAELINAALTTSDFPLLLANVSGKALRMGYEFAPFTASWTGERTVADFKQQSLVSLSEAPSLDKVNEGAEYKYGNLSESNSTFKADTYGKLVRITRQALINDDLSAFSNMPQAMGQAARRLEMKMVYDLLTSNPTLGDGFALFHANHGNLSTAGSPDLAKLGAARAAMRKQKGIAGADYLDPTPRYLIVPVALETACEQLLASLVDPSKNNATPNVEWVRGLELVADPRLDEVSASVWYLAASPQQTEGIVRAYVEGQDRPHLDQQEHFSRDLVEFKVRMDIGVGVVDYRALHRVG
ncbi:MAG: ClpP-like prohead protease/major capsid protein fusion protein [Piscinibacter sp.]|uniref:ClpP-like prohead protease/major capsid protein fusion protein n=1 Tax=Piscinibacter sp. TaxID=1903157 RepID=UPI003D13AEF9